MLQWPLRGIEFVTHSHVLVELSGSFGRENHKAVPLSSYSKWVKYSNWFSSYTPPSLYDEHTYMLVNNNR